LEDRAKQREIESSTSTDLLELLELLCSISEAIHITMQGSASLSLPPDRHFILDVATRRLRWTDKTSSTTTYNYDVHLNGVVLTTKRQHRT